jgi:uncharacterized protein YneF (UPF0154 family)
MASSTRILIALALLLGLVAGFFLGRAHLEHQWSQPRAQALLHPAIHRHDRA